MEDRIESCAFCGKELKFVGFLGCGGMITCNGKFFCNEDCYGKFLKKEEGGRVMGLIRDDLRQEVTELVQEALAGLGVIGDPRTIQLKCQRVDCFHNHSFWCQKEDGRIGIDCNGCCQSYQKW